MKYNFIVLCAVLSLVNFPVLGQSQKIVPCSDIFEYSVKIAEGKTDILSADFSDLELGTLNGKELRLLRNMIYAKYGYKFKSLDLQKYFMKFTWYKPMHENIDSLMTELDKKNIGRVKFFEDFKGSDSHPEKINLNGLWQDIPIAASGWSDVFYFSGGNSVCFYVSQMDSDNDDDNGGKISKFLGTYKIQDSFLYINFKNIVLNNEATYSCDCNLKFPIYSYEENKKIAAELYKNKVSIGTKNFYYFEGTYE